MHPSSPQNKIEPWTCAIAAGVLIHLALAMVLSWILLDRRELPPVIEVLAPTPIEKPSREPNRPAKAAKPTVAKAAPASATALPRPKTLFRITVPDSPVILPPSQPLEVDPSVSATAVLPMGTIGLTPFVQKGKEEFGKGTGEGLFDPEKVNQRSLAVVLDHSNSMKGHSLLIEDLLNSRFRQAIQTRVKGCSLRRNSRVLRQIVSLARYEETEVIYFICDLQDGYDPAGIRALSEALLEGPKPVRLEILSYDKLAAAPLYEIVRLSGGEVHQMNRAVLRL